jgi:uncharacterized protein (DUF1800 family)
MPLTRRAFLRLSALLAASATLSACTPAYTWLAEKSSSSPPPLPADEDPAAFRLLNRLTFGPRSEERLRLAETGARGWIEEQLAPALIDDTPCDLRLRNLGTLTMQASDLFDLSDKLFDDQDRQSVPGELRQATLLRQVYSRRQLYERVVEFWSDHFNISVEKGDCFYLKTVDDRQVIRKHALGTFGELLLASARSPAMLVYLDNQANHKDAPNENYARELLELHSLGVDGGYTQHDVMELARCLTGWTVKEHFWRGQFTFRPERHDPGRKRVLGIEIEPAGAGETEGVIERLATHPSTARFIAHKLARRFIADQSPVGLVERTATAFLKSGGDIRSTLSALLLDGQASMQPKYKRPVDFVVSAVRMLQARCDGGPALQGYLARLGQSYFAWPTPDGYPDRSNAWQGNLLPRWQFALALAQNELAGAQLDLLDLIDPDSPTDLAALLDSLSRRLLGGPLVEAQPVLQALRASGASHGPEMAAVITAGLLASPAFQWR